MFADLIEAGCFTTSGVVCWQVLAGSGCVICCVYCRSMFYRSVFILGGEGGGGGVLCIFQPMMGGGPSYVFSVSPGCRPVMTHLAQPGTQHQELCDRSIVV